LYIKQERFADLGQLCEMFVNLLKKKK